MRVMLGRILLSATLAALLPLAAIAQQTSAAPASSTASGTSSNTATPFAAPVVLRGKLGNESVQMRLQPKLEDPDSVEGDYFVFGKGSKILLAGEASGKALTMEESEDGIDVSGQWDGKLDGKTLRGTWVSDDGSISKEFVLDIQPASAKPAKPGSKPVKKSTP
ncbi:hypothetical protein ACO0LO_00495 [Undibacterium sp. TJN25]|uniref:hypothetical protein n=1 Tax=Undibacterium sp. TJN25 TaxID=3413056 RepID=UPI003BF25B8E